MNDASRFAKNRLQEASRAKRGARLMRVVFWTAAVALLILVSVALLDYWLMLVPSVRYAGLAVLGALVLGGIYQLVKTLRQPAQLKDAALDAEAEKPEMGCELSTAAEYLSGERKPAQQYENELAAALEDKAAKHLRKIDLPYWKGPLRPAVFVVLILLVALFFGVLASGGFTAFLRAMMPWSDVSYTTVEVKPGNVEIPVGQDLEVKSVFTGRIPKAARFQWRDEGAAEWQFAALTRNEQGEYTYPLKDVRTPLKYRVSGNDAVSPAFTIQPYLPPEVKEWNVKLAFPEYTRKATAAQNSPEITALRGTVATVQIAPTVKLSMARLRFKEGAPVEMLQQQNGFWKVDLKISKDAEFTVELADEKGRPGEDAATYKITAIPDETPQVEILEPGQDIRAMATNTVPVKIKAADDFGLRELKIVYHRLGGPEEIISAKRNGETNSEFTAEIPLSGLGLKDYELVAYHALAVDNNTLDGPGIGKSDVFFVEITDQEGGECKCQGKGQKVNLLVIQKQIIADTSALASNAASEKFEELALRQKDAAEFGRIYYTNIAAATGAAEAAAEMGAAIKAMEKAQAALEQRQSRLALPPEEIALASLYQVIRLMPELEDLPTVPPPPPKEEEEEEEKPPVLAVVLEEIKKKKEEEPNNKELEEALETAKRLQEEHASLSIGVQNSGNNPMAQGGETQIDRSGKSESKSKAGQGKTQPKQMAKAEAKKSSGKNGQQGQGKQGAGKEGQKQEKTEDEFLDPEREKQESQSGNEGNGKGNAESNGKGKGRNGNQPGTPSEQEAELAKETKELAEKLARMSGKDARLGHGIAKRMTDAAEMMEAAAAALGRGDTQNAGSQGAQAGVALDSAVAMLERLLNGRAERADVSKEDAPKQYEAVIAEYFKALSYDH